MKTKYKGGSMTHWACLICYRTFPHIFRGILDKINLQLISLVVLPVSVKIFAIFLQSADGACVKDERHANGQD